MKDLDIKDIWKQGGENDQEAFTESQIETMIRKGSDSLIHRFVKTLTIELWLNLFILSVLSIGVLYAQEWLVGVGLMLINILFFVYYKDIIKKLKQEEIDSTVLEYLYTIQGMVKRFILHYKIVAFVLPVLIVSAVFYLESNEFYNRFSEEPKSVAIGMAIGFITAVPISLYMIHLMYGKKAKKLSQMIESLEQEET